MQTSLPRWHQLSIETTVQEAASSLAQGLSDADAQARLHRDGPNQLIAQDGKGPFRILWEQLSATLMIILIAAAILSWFIGDEKDAIVILAIVLLNAVLGFSQEYRAEKALAALKNMAVPRARVKRDGHWKDLSSSELVLGDLVMLEAGTVIPADGRVVECARLAVEEAALTGESLPVDKSIAPLATADIPLGDRRNMVYRGTLVSFGRGHFIVTSTGMKTELGRIASLLQSTGREATPLQKRLNILGKRLAIVALILVGIVFALGLSRGELWKTMLLTAVSLAVAAVPEGLPAAVTISLALGAQRMLKRQALIRKLPAVETLGSITVIGSDKTGTLTENRMTVTTLDVAGQRHILSSSPTFLSPALTLLLSGATLCNDATYEETPQGPRLLGDPTESALLVVAAQHGLEKATLEKLYPRRDERAFDSIRKRMTTLHELSPIAGPLHPFAQGEAICFTKGSVDGLLTCTTHVWKENQILPINDDWREKILAANRELAAEGLRVLGVGFRFFTIAPQGEELDHLEEALVFVGLLGMIDPPRAQVKDAIAICREAGIRPIMITGDHPLTAQSIARQLRLTQDPSALTGQDLDRLSAKDFDQCVRTTSVFARVSPEHKLRIVDALQRQGQVVAMTGDGVNDAPALKKADIGVAMGITGTDVSKEAAAMVLLDDNFSTIVAAVEEGRVIFDNIRKFIKYLLTTNSAEIWVMLAAPFLGMPLPLLPLQILWINLVTDGLPALSLSLEPAEPRTMKRPPRPPRESLFARGLGWHALGIGLWMGGLSLGVGYLFWRAGRPEWRSVLFTTLAFSQMAHVLAIRSETLSIFKLNFFSNKALLASVLLTVILQLAVLYHPSLAQLFGTMPLFGAALLAPFLAGLCVIVPVEMEKGFRRGSPITLRSL